MLPFHLHKEFEVRGVYAVNKNIFEEHEFLTAYVTNRPLNDAHQGKNCNPTMATDSDILITPAMLRPYPKAP